MPIRDGVTLIIDEHGAELEVVTGRMSTHTWPLDDDATLTLRDGCDAAYKIRQTKVRRTRKAGTCPIGTRIKSPTGGVWTRADSEHLMRNPPKCRWRDESGSSHTLKCSDDVEVLP
jgi:hypothetical protein